MSFVLHVLGEPRLLDSAGNPVSLALGKPFALLTYVAFRGDGVPRSELSEIFWPGSTRYQSRHSLRQALWLLRTALDGEILEGKEDIRVVPGTLATDLEGFKAALADGDLRMARELWRGPFLDRFSLTRTPGWSFWVDEVRQDLELRFRKALLLESGALAEEGHRERALSLVETAIEVSPLFLEAHLARIRLLSELLQLDAAREAIADAYHLRPEEAEGAAELAELETQVDQLVQARSRETPADGLMGERLEFVGRSREMADLERLWRQVGRGRAVHALITGPAGIGKTRLAKELREVVTAAGGASVLVKGNRGESELRLGVGMDLVRKLLTLPGAAGISAASDALLKTLVPSLARRATDLQKVKTPALAPLLDAVADVVASVSLETPLLLVVDDIQWADRQSRLLIAGLARRLGDTRCFLVAATRSDAEEGVLADLRDTFLEELGGQEFALGPLSREEVAELLALLAEMDRPGEAASVVIRIHGVTRGNPLFIEELLKKLREDGVIREAGQGWVFHTGALPPDLSLPGNIRLLLKDRLRSLSPPARSLALILAREARTAPPEALLLRAGLSPEEIEGATTELLAKEVVRPSPGGALEFTHDELRDAAALGNGDLNGSPGLMGRPPERRSRRLLYGVGGLLVLIVGTLGISRQWPVGERSPPPFGGGRLLAISPSPGASIAFLVTDRNPEEWPVTTTVRAGSDAVHRVFQLPAGGTFRYGVADDPVLGSEITLVHAGEAEDVILGGPGDQYLLDMAPDGREILFATENTGDSTFSHSLLTARPDGSSPRLLLRASGSLGPAAYSPDGDLIAVVILAHRDTLAILSRDGRRIQSFVDGEVLRLAWCGSALMVTVQTREGSYLRRLDLDRGVSETVAPLSSPYPLACSPDGSAVVHAGVRGSEAVMLLTDLTSGETHVLPVDVIQYPGLDWVPDGIPPVVTSVEAVDPGVTIEWGQRRQLSAMVRYSDGSRRQDLINWESLDPAIASVNRTGLVTANREGRAHVVAGWGQSFRDTVIVEVRYEGPGTALFMDRFQTLDTTRWLSVGYPRPVVVEREGDSVLFLNGNERSTDGLVFADPIPMGRGVTVEWEFHLDPTRDVHQHLAVCLRRGDPTEVRRDGSGLESGRASACFRYPARELAHFDPAEAVLEVSPSVSTWIRRPGLIPASEWTRVTLQVRADGQVSLFLDQEHVATSPVNLPTGEEGPWLLLLLGKSVGAPVLLRDLVIWEEVRYRVPSGRMEPVPPPGDQWTVGSPKR